LFGQLVVVWNLVVLHFALCNFQHLLVVFCGCYINALYCLMIRMSRGQNVMMMIHKICIQHNCNVLDMDWVYSKHFFGRANIYRHSTPNIISTP
jgi:hypothetical protein